MSVAVRTCPQDPGSGRDGVEQIGVEWTGVVSLGQVADHGVGVVENHGKAGWPRNAYLQQISEWGEDRVEIEHRYASGPSCGLLELWSGRVKPASHFISRAIEHEETVRRCVGVPTSHLGKPRLARLDDFVQVLRSFPLLTFGIHNVGTVPGGACSIMAPHHMKIRGAFLSSPTAAMKSDAREAIMAKGQKRSANSKKWAV